jgi:hypothetical protein
MEEVKGEKDAHIHHGHQGLNWTQIGSQQDIHRKGIKVDGI